MGWAGQTWIEVVAESSYGVFAAGGAKWYPVLDGGNSFTPRIVPARQVIRSADSGNRRRQVVANRQVIAGTLKTLLYPSQAAYIMTAATTLTSNVLGSYSFQYFDSTRVQRYLGGMCSAMRISSNAQQDYVTCETDWIFQSLDPSFTVFAQPAQTNYPVENPYQHVNTKGNVSLAASAITLYKQVDINLKNMLVGTWDESTTISACYYCGRDLDFTAVPQYTAATYRTDYEAQTPLTWVIEWANAVPHSVTFTCEASGYIDGISDDLPLDGPGYQSLANQIFFDKTATTDFAVVVV
jgi:hypothetical protein